MATTQPNIEKIAEEKDRAGSAGSLTELYKKDGKVVFSHFSVFDRNTFETDAAYGEIDEQDYRKGIEQLAEQGYCRIPLAGYRQNLGEGMVGFVEMESNGSGVKINFACSGYHSGIRGIPTSWNATQLLLK